ncbi:hypothetical protein AN958_12402 [Leucoagaricus sp. SymC.cos]|nr:hypothetical protein AN958_12402 [Leucoagaricus sp. SymC.cos]
MKLHFTSSYHSEGNSQTEHTNQTLEQYLQVYCNYQQVNWAELLLLAEFSFNNVPNATTSVSPFFTNKGYHLNITVYPGQKVFVKAKYFHTICPSKKLSEKYLGPYEIIAQPGSHSFTLQLPDSMCDVHSVFSVSMLELSTPNPFPTCSALPPASVVIDGEPEFEIAHIVNSKIDWCQACKLLYKVIWLGYKDTEDKSSWLPASKLEHAPKLVADFHAAYPHKLGPLSSL